MGLTPDTLTFDCADPLRVAEIPASAVDGQATFWTVMLDPEGNQFCVLRGPGDGWSPA